MGGDDQVPSRISGSDAQVREDPVLDRSLAPSNEVEVALSAGRTAHPPGRCGSFSAIQTAYRSLTAPTSLGTATSGLLSQMGR
jgi:hypothetical protein